ncbi:hypothetical protein QR680_013874 [Steinernema hermaphroditum]|uniref:Uncharacterized protein n=1 Tax=Steinernema hermaphroditum TaxID=289476 RepID=A0AA39I6Z4_9BILA|nr:hypothetical protein QR680_013874 [Steinernema hermaphroditum]
MSDYDRVRVGALKLKGNKSLFKSDKSKKKKSKKDQEAKNDPDKMANGGWWRVLEELDLKGGANIAFEYGDYSRTYIAAMDNGKFTLGAPHSEGEGPNPEEVFTLIKTPDDPKISMRTGYGKYIGVDAEGKLNGVAEAIGARERFQVVFEEGKSAIQSASSNMFICMRPSSDGLIMVTSKTAKDDEMINVRTDSEKVGPVDWRSEEDKLGAKKCETAYVKMYQHSKVGLKGRHIAVDLNDRASVRRAQDEGTLHELLLDRRAKTKSDKYC